MVDDAVLMPAWSSFPHCSSSVVTVLLPFWPCVLDICVEQGISRGRKAECRAEGYIFCCFLGVIFFNTGNLYPPLYQRPVFFTAVLSLSVPLTDPTGEMGPYVQDQFYGTAPLFPKQCGP